jgi:hypothetical protein
LLRLDQLLGDPLLLHLRDKRRPNRSPRRQACPWVNTPTRH